MSWKEIIIDSIHEALDESGETLPDAAIENIYKWISDAYDNQELATGPAENPLQVEIEELKREHTKEIGVLNKRELVYRENVGARAGVGWRRVHIESGHIEISRQ